MPDYVPIQDLTIVGSIGNNDLFPLSDGSGAYAVRGSTIKSYAATDAAAAAADAALSKTAAQNAATAAGNAQTAAEEAAATAAATAETVGGKIEDLTETNDNAYVKKLATLTWEQGGIANNGGDSTASDRVRTPNGSYFTPRNCVNPYLTVKVTNANLEVKIQEYDGTPATSVSATGRYSAYKSGTWTYDITPEYNYRLCARKTGGGSISTSDIGANDISVYWFVGTDTGLSLSNKAADAKQTGDSIDLIKMSAIADMRKTIFSPYYSIVSGYFTASGVAVESSSGVYARVQYIYVGVGTRNGFALDSDTYEYKVSYYDSTGATDGTGFLGDSGYVTGVTLIPDTAKRVGITFKRVDGTAMSSSDYDAIKAAFFVYRPTDSTVSIYGVPADAKRAGDVLSALTYKYVDSLDLIWDQGGISSANGTNSSTAETNIIRTKGYTMLDSLRCFVCFVPDGYELGVRRYKRDESVTYIGYNDSDSGLIVVDNGAYNGANGYRFVLRKADRTDLTPSDVPAGLKIVPIYRQPWEKEACGYSKPTVTVKRNNPDIVSDFLAVAETYYTHRNDKTGNVYDMVYGYNTCVQTTEYTNQIDCSTFVGLVLRGWSYEETQYYTKQSGTTYPANPAKEWAVNPADYKCIGNLFVEATGEANTNPSSVRMASQQGQWMIDQGQRVPMDGRMVNVEPGDIVFWANKTSNNNPTDPNRFMTIGHVGICCEKRPTTEDDPWPAELYPYAHTIIEVRGGTPVVNKRYLEVGWDDEDEGTITHSGVNYAVLVCRPDLGALS